MDQLQLVIPYIFIGLSSLGLFYGGWFLWIGPLLVFLVHPILDAVIGRETSNSVTKKNELVNDLVLLSFVPILTALVLKMLFEVSFGSWSSIEKIGMVVGTGLFGGVFGITVAHELVHRKSALQRFFGVWLLTLASYAHFRVEHVFGHHRYVATPEDPVSARKDESIYAFWIRAVIMSYLSAWKIEVHRLKKESFINQILKNRMVHYLVILIALALAIANFFGSSGLVAFFASSLIAILLLESVDYIEHYGLVRHPKGERFEPYQPHHSWDSSYKLTNWILFNLGKHSDHHLLAHKPYPELQVLEPSPKHPWGYSTMILIAFIPPLWFRIMNQYLLRDSLRDHGT